MKALAMVAASVLVLGSVHAEVPVAGLGWRYDGSGVYADCKPPVTWDVEKKENVRWSIETPNWGYGQPVEVGDAVVFMCEPGSAELVWPTLVCVSRKDGKERWRCAIDPLMTQKLDDAKRAELTAEWAYVHELYQFIYPTCAKYPEASEEERVKIRAQLTERQCDMASYKHGYGLLRQLKINNERFNKAVKTMAAYGPVITTWQNFGDSRIGTSFPAPVSDGKSVYVMTLYGTVAAVDLASGKIQWMVDSGYRQVQHNGLAASPRLFGDLLLAYAGGIATAYDRATGAIRFRHGDKPSRYKHGDITSSIVMTVGQTPVWITTRGEAIRLPDGKMLATDLGNPNYQSWACDDATDRVFYSTGGDNVKGDFIGLRLSLSGEAFSHTNVFSRPGGLGHTSATFYNETLYHSASRYKADDGSLIGTYGEGVGKAEGYGAPGSVHAPVSGNLILVADNRVYGFAADGSIRGSYKKWKQIPVTNDGIVQVYGVDGKLLGENSVPAAEPASSVAVAVRAQGVSANGISSGAFSIGRDAVYVRNNTHLWCFGAAAR